MNSNKEKIKVKIEEKKESSWSDSKIAVLINSYFTPFLIMVLFLTISIGVFFFVLPVVSQIKEVSEEVETQEKYVNKLRSDLESLRSLNSLYNTMDSRDVDKVYSMLPNKDRIEDLMGQLEAIAKKKGLIPVDIKVREEESVTKGVVEELVIPGVNVQKSKVDVPPGVGKIMIDINFTDIDSYAKMKSIFDAIEKNMRLIDVYDVYYTASGVLSLKAYAYYLK